MRGLKFFLLGAALIAWISLSAQAAEEATAAPLGPVAHLHPALHLVGDSTMADKPVDPPNPERGWGQAFPSLFKEPARVVNYAVNGRSTKSFRDEGRWNHVLSQLAPGDFVLIEFGHNDEKDYDPTRYAAPRTDYMENLRRFIHEVRAAQATPLLATPIYRRKFDDQNRLIDTHGLYPDAMREVAAAEHVELVDLHQLTRPLLEKLGPDDSKQLFVWVKAGEFTRYPDGRQDDTHLNEKGALTVAQIVADQLRASKNPLADWLR